MCLNGNIDLQLPTVLAFIACHLEHGPSSKFRWKPPNLTSGSRCWRGIGRLSGELTKGTVARLARVFQDLSDLPQADLRIAASALMGATKHVESDSGFSQLQPSPAAYEVEDFVLVTRVKLWFLLRI